MDRVEGTALHRVEGTYLCLPQAADNPVGGFAAVNIPPNAVIHSISGIIKEGDLTVACIHDPSFPLPYSRVDTFREINSAGDPPRRVSVRGINENDSATMWIKAVCEYFLPELTIGRPTLEFAPTAVGQHNDSKLIVTNLSDRTVTVDIGVGGSAGGFMIASELPLVVDQGASSQVIVRFAPKGLGMVAGSLAISSPDNPANAASVILTGTGVDPVGLHRILPDPRDHP